MFTDEATITDWRYPVTIASFVGLYRIIRFAMLQSLLIHRQYEIPILVLYMGYPKLLYLSLYISPVNWQLKCPEMEQVIKERKGSDP